MHENGASSTFSRLEPKLEYNMIEEAVKLLRRKGKFRFLTNCVIGYLLCKTLAKIEIKQCRRKNVKVLMTKFVQLYDKITFLTTNTNKLTEKKKRKSVNDTSVIKKKRDNYVKDRTIADENKNGLEE